MFKFLHTADIHLDSPMLNLNRYDDAPREEFRDATRRAFDNIVALAISEQVKFVLVAGDLYDGDCDDFHTPRHFRKKMGELEQQGIRVFIIQGNHDAQNRMTKAFRLQLPDNVRLFSTTKPETVILDEISVAIHGQGFAQSVVTDDLSKQYPEPVAGLLNIGLLHTSCGPNDQHDNYAPSTIKGLTSKGYDYWALGHIHKSEVLFGPGPWIVYPGNPQGRSVRETGARGCVVVNVDGDRLTQKRFDVDVVRWQVCDVDVSGCSDGLSTIPQIHTAIREQIAEADGRSLAIRLILSGKCEAHRDLIRLADHWDREIRTSVLDHFEEQVWVEKIQSQTEPATPPSDEVDSALHELVAQLNSSDLGDAALTELQAEFEKMLATVPTDSRIRREELEIDVERTASSLLDEARELLVARLTQGEPT